MSGFCNWFLMGFSDTRSAIAQVIGFVPLILAMFTYVQTNREKIIFVKVCSDLLWVAHFFALGEWTGGMINAVNAVRGVVFSQRHKTWAQSSVIPVLFCTFTVVCALPGFEGVKSLLAMIGSCLGVIGFWQLDVRRLRLFTLVGVTLWVAYGIWTVSIPAIISNSMSICSIVLAFCKEKSRRE